MGNRLFFGAKGTHEAEVLQSPSTKDEAKAAGGYSGAQHVRQEEVIRQQPTTKSTEASTTMPKSAWYEDSAYGTKPNTTSRCPKDLRKETGRQMTEYKEVETLLTSGTVDLTKTFTEAVAASSSGNSKNDPFASQITHLRASTLCRGRRTKGSMGRGQSEDVKVRRPRTEDGDFQHYDSSIRRSGRHKVFSWARSCSRWGSARRDSSRKPKKHLTFASFSSEDEKTDED